MASLKNQNQSPLSRAKQAGLVAGKNKYEKHITSEEKYKQSQIIKENNRLYSKILSIENNI